MTVSGFTRRRTVSIPSTHERARPRETIGNRQPLLLFLTLENDKLMAQGKDFCLECTSRTKRITEDGEQGNRAPSSQRSLSMSRVSAIGTATIEFLVGTVIKGERAFLKSCCFALRL